MIPNKYLKNENAENIKYFRISFSNLYKDGSPLHYVNNDIQTKFYIEIGYNVNDKTKINNDTPLHFCNNYKIAKLLIENGANVNIKNNKGQTPLHLCINYDMVKLLIECNANISVKDNNGNTPLHLCKDSKIMELLLKNDNNIYVNNIHSTILHNLCINKNDLECVKIIIKYVPNIIYSQDTYGYTVFHLCNNYEIFNYLFYELDDKYFVNTEDNIGSICLHYINNINIIKLIIKYININHVNIYRMTPMHNLCKNDCNLEIIKYLLNNYSSPYILDIYNMTPIHYKLIHTECIDIFKDHIEYVINIQNINGETILHTISRYCYDINIYRILINKYNADINIKNNNGMYPSDFINKKYKKIYNILTIIKSDVKSSRKR